MKAQEVKCWLSRTSLGDVFLSTKKPTFSKDGRFIQFAEDDDEAVALLYQNDHDKTPFDEVIGERETKYIKIILED